MRNYARLLRDNPDYARLWFAQVISLLGDWFDTIALATLVVAYSPENKGLAISALLLARFIPPMLISPVAGVLIDRFDRKRLLVWSNYLRAVVVSLFLLTTHGSQWLWLIYTLSVIQFSLSAVFEPGQSAIIPNLVRREDLVPANTLVSITWSAMLAFGAVVGGLVSSTFGTNTALIIDSLSFAIAGLLIAPIKAYKFKTTEPQSHEPKRDTSFAEGLRFIRRNPPVLATLLVKFGTSLGSIDTLMTIYATQLFVLGNEGQLSLGIMYSSFGVGAIVGPLLLNRFNNGSVGAMRRLISIGFAWAVIGWLVMGGASSLLIVCVALALRAMGGSVNWTYSTITIQKIVPDHYLGRMFSIDMALFNLAVVLSNLVHGQLIDLLGSENIRLIAFGTAVVSVFPLLAWVLLTRRLQRTAEVAVAAD